MSSLWGELIDDLDWLDPNEPLHFDQFRLLSIEETGEVQVLTPKAVKFESFNQFLPKSQLRVHKDTDELYISGWLFGKIFS